MNTLKLITPILVRTMLVSLARRLYTLPLQIFRIGPKTALTLVIKEMVGLWRYQLWHNNRLPASVTTDNAFFRELADGRSLWVKVTLIGGNTNLALMQVQLDDQHLGYFYLFRRGVAATEEVEFEGIDPIPFDRAQPHLLIYIDQQTAEPVLHLMDWVRSNYL